MPLRFSGNFAIFINSYRHNNLPTRYRCLWETILITDRDTHYCLFLEKNFIHCFLENIFDKIWLFVAYSKCQMFLIKCNEYLIPILHLFTIIPQDQNWQKNRILFSQDYQSTPYIGNIHKYIIACPCIATTHCNSDKLVSGW